MKNIIIVLALFLAIGVNAQTAKTVSTKTVTTTKLTPEMAAKKNVVEIAAFTPVDEQTQIALEGLFMDKYNALSSSPNLSDKRRSVISENTSKKLQAILDANTYSKLRANTKLYDSLIK